MLTVKQVAEQLTVSQTCVYQLVSSGKLACHRIGIGRGAIRVSESDLSAFLNLNWSGEGRPAGDGQQPRRTRALKHLRLSNQGKQHGRE